MRKADVGLIGLAVMGENLAFNMESKGYAVAVYNRTTDVVDRFMQGRAKRKDFIGAHSMAELAASVSRPRKIMMMVKSGAPVDSMISQLVPFLDEGDIIIDGGNSDFHDTERRVAYLEGKGLLFVGTGISGGEEGALKGPSVMPGGSEAAWPEVKELLQKISAKLDDGSPCCEWMGKGGAGHFVKTVHNGIEYGDMQLISEAYFIMKRGLGMDNAAIADVFGEWNKGELDSYLIQITADILRRREPGGEYLVDDILDVAGQKGTGKWSAVAALDEGDPMTLITQAVFARSLSAQYDERRRASGIFGGNFKTIAGLTAEEIGDALYASKIISYAQGFSLLGKASREYGWDLHPADIARIWRNGCIIRSSFLRRITSAYVSDPSLDNLLFDGFFAEALKSALPAWRKTASLALESGIPIPAMSAALTYFDGLRTMNSAASLIQAQRDYFGAHTYERTDSPRGTFFHTDWTKEL
jgi:6-phosphogluconate dehydrogenase